MMPTEKTEHYTIMFNTFVFMQIFNEINARKLGNQEYNVFHNFFNNFLFLGILLATICVQIAMVQYGGVPTRTAPLTAKQHLLCICIGLFSFIQGKLIR
jgi:Ca2+ transporting ATPase